MSYLPLEISLKSKLNAVSKDALEKELPDGEWTKLIKLYLGDLGESLGYITATSGHSDRFFGEWLFDLIWYADDKAGHIIELKFIMESEWQTGFDHIWYDFEKLLVAKCHHKMMIFQCVDSNRKKFIQDMTNSIDTYYPAVPNERYLFACWNMTKKCFQFDLKVTK